jgi:hypothetical protein
MSPPRTKLKAAVPKRRSSPADYQSVSPWPIISDSDDIGRLMPGQIEVNADHGR